MLSPVDAEFCNLFKDAVGSSDYMASRDARQRINPGFLPLGKDGN
jgi:hypothetical protein